MSTNATATLPAVGRISYEDFLNWEGENQHVEWVDGEVVEMSPVDNLNNRNCGMVMRWISAFVEHYDLGEVRFEPFNMKTGPGLPGRSPDILFVARQNEDRLKPLHLDGPADLVVEVISAGTRRTDKVTKFREYEQGGVREYWLIDPIRKEAEFFKLDDDGRYAPITIDHNNRFNSVVLPGFWLDVAWLWQAKPPTIMELMRHWRII